MGYTPVEWMAIIVAVLAAVKLIVIWRSPKFWMKNVDAPIFRNKNPTMVISLILTIGSLFYLTQELTIVQIFGTLFFFASISLLSATAYNRELSAFTQSIMKKGNVLKRAWLSVVIWIILIVWALRVLFA